MEIKHTLRPAAFETGGQHFPTTSKATVENSAILRAIEKRKADRLDLLEALQHAVRFHDQLTPADIDRFKAVIAKATGVQA